MNSNFLIKKKWLRKIPVSSNYRKQYNTSVFFKRTAIRHTILNWDLLYFYLRYHLNILTQICITNTNTCLITTDSNALENILTSAALKMKISYVCGNWRGGTLTQIKIKEKIPNFVINFGIYYSVHFYNEIAILLIPTINFKAVNNAVVNKGVIYSLPLFNMNKESFCSLSLLYMWIIKKKKKSQFFTNFETINEINVKYKIQLRLINNKTQIYKRWTKKYINSFKRNKYFNFKNWNFFIENFNYLYRIKKNYIPFYHKNSFNPMQFVILQQNFDIYKKSSYKKRYYILKNRTFDFKNIKWKNNII